MAGALAEAGVGLEEITDRVSVVAKAITLSPPGCFSSLIIDSLT